jgi:DNA-directed RNA polymerase I subunit RPA2
MSDEKNSSANASIGYTIRYPRNPVIGDKFSSRHGQKGVMSVIWPQEDMPFTENGITPDIIINPHAFPSRMTIGMLIESLAGKGGALNGKYVNLKTFEKYKDDDCVDYFGKELTKNGYNYHGNENMYSGIFGNEMKVDIYIGLVYYQRLRHMVSDKSQARATGPIDVLTHQPVKGRKKQGGIRFGEMERDSLLAHGASFCLNDRLMRCSDYSEGYVCTKCNSIISCYLNKQILKST